MNSQPNPGPTQAEQDVALYAHDAPVPLIYLLRCFVIA